MKYEKGMKRYAKAGGKYREDDEGGFYKASDGKMRAMEGEDKPEDKAGQADDHAYDENEEIKAKKSEVTVDDFQKSLDQLEELAKADDPQSRKDELLQKAQGGELSDDERDELFKALGGDVEEEDDGILEEITKSFDDSPELQKALDVSEYLEAQHSALLESLGEVAKSIDASDQRQAEFNLVFAKGVHQMGQLVKSMSERLGVLENQPARAPKSILPGQPAAKHTIEKSFGGEAPAGDNLSKSDILDTMEAMMSKSMDAGKGGVSACGEDIAHATAKYEQTSQISKSMLDEIRKFKMENAH